MNIAPDEVWFVSFPLEEDPSKFLPRPVIVLDEETLRALPVKVTTSDLRENDKYDISRPTSHTYEAFMRSVMKASFSATAQTIRTVRRCRFDSTLTDFDL